MSLNRRQLIAATPALLGVPALKAQGRQKISYAYLMDPAYDAVVWALRNGKVRSDAIEVEATGMLIPQLLQATATKQYDVVMTAVIGVPAAAARGLELRILSAALQYAPAGEGGGVWVKKDSPIKSPAELKGKTMASYGLRSTGYMYAREAMRLAIQKLPIQAKFVIRPEKVVIPVPQEDVFAQDAEPAVAEDAPEA